MPFADEEAVVQTRFATSTIALFCAALGEDASAAAADAERVLVEPVPVVRAALGEEAGRYGAAIAAWRAAGVDEEPLASWAADV